MKLLIIAPIALYFAAHAVHASTVRGLQTEGNPFILCGDAGFCNTVRANCVTDAEGTQTCVCFDGYGGENCVDNIDECVLIDDYPCNGPPDSTFCVNEQPPLKYKCGCVAGWNPVIPDNVTNIVTDPVPLAWRPLFCFDIDECADSNLNICPDDSSCTNAPGSFECVCSDTERSFNGTICVLPPTTAPTTAAPSISASPTTDPSGASVMGYGKMVMAASAALLSLAFEIMD